MRRVVLSVIVGITFYTLVDILLWQRIFERNALWDYAYPYSAGWETALLGIIGVGVVLLWESYERAMYFALSLYTLAFSGLEDILYYVLDGRAIPSALPWLNENRLMLFTPVTSNALIASALVWVVFWVAVGVGIKYNEEVLSGKEKTGNGRESRQSIQGVARCPRQDLLVAEVTPKRDDARRDVRRG